MIKTVIRFFGPKLFGKAYADALKSKNYPEFCERVFGRNLCQFNMLDEEQLQWLITAINNSQGDAALDIGCGVGILTQFLAEKSEFKWTGLDYASAAISEAQRRTKNTNNKVNFILGDLNKLENLKFTNNQFDLILGIDTLYFIKDLELTLDKLRSFMKPCGQMIFFYTSKINSSKEIAKLEPNETLLGQYLNKKGLPFTAINFTDNDRALWKRSKEVAQDMMIQFKEEGLLQIVKGRIFESKKNLDWHERNLVRRYAYVIKSFEN